MAALAAAGYRPSRDAHHYRTILSLEFTIGADSKLIAKFDAFTSKSFVSAEIGKAKVGIDPTGFHAGGVFTFKGEF